MTKSRENSSVQRKEGSGSAKDKRNQKIIGNVREIMDQARTTFNIANGINVWNLLLDPGIF